MPRNFEKLPQNYREISKIYREIFKIYREIAAKFSIFTAKLPRNLGFWAVAVPRKSAQFTATNLCP
ncbi:MAG: hypothetical protein GY820_37300 [Gammaproteobacteria bacterium]|nr:hypothetical protein [Gammaproteobacteria bacterium]